MKNNTFPEWIIERGRNLSQLSLILMLIFTSCTLSADLINPFFKEDQEKKSQDAATDSKRNDDTDQAYGYQVTLEPLHQTTLTAEITSPIAKINKKLGESFKKGEILVQFEDLLFRSNLKKYEAVLERAKTELSSKKQLFADNIMSLFELKEAETNVAIAEADLSLAQKNMNATTIKAPYDGKVVSVDLQEFEVAQTTSKIMEIVDDTMLVARFLVPSSLLPSLKIGMAFRIELNETDETLNVTLSRIGSIIDPSSRTIKLEADIDNSASKLTSGMTGRAIMPVGEQ